MLIKSDENFRNDVLFMEIMKNNLVLCKFNWSNYHGGWNIDSKCSILICKIQFHIEIELSVFCNNIENLIINSSNLLCMEIPKLTVA